MRFSFIATEKACYPVALMCRVLHVSRSGYYAWRKRPAAERRRQDQRLALEVAAIHAESRGRYGSPRVHAELHQRGQRCARKRVARLMRTAGLRARVRRRFRCTTDSKHAMAIKGNLLARRFAMSAPNAGWVSDITYLWTGTERPFPRGKGNRSKDKENFQADFLPPWIVRRRGRSIPPER